MKDTFLKYLVHIPIVLFIWFIIYILYFLPNINIEKNKKEVFNHICFTLDNTILPNISEQELKNETATVLYDFVLKYINEMHALKNTYTTKEHFEDKEEEASNMYSTGYKNILAIQNELYKRRTYCFKNYCNKFYYTEDAELGINNLLKIYLRLNCEETLKNNENKR